MRETPGSPGVSSATVYYSTGISEQPGAGAADTEPLSSPPSSAGTERSEILSASEQPALSEPPAGVGTEISELLPDAEASAGPATRISELPSAGAGSAL